MIVEGSRIKAATEVLNRFETEAPRPHLYSPLASCFTFIRDRPNGVQRPSRVCNASLQLLQLGDPYVRQCGSDPIVTYGFNSLNKTKRLGLHVGNINSFHNRELKKSEDLMIQDRSIVVSFHKQIEKEKNEHRIRLNASIKARRLLLKNTFPFHGHDESEMPIYKGMFLETFSLIGDCNEDVVDESSDVSNKEQMAMVLRYADARSIVKERIFGIVHVRGQGYDEASNIRCKFNGLMALILNDNRSTYYIHCFAHQLQLIVVAVANKHDGVEKFFNMLGMVINVVNASSKHKDMFRQSYKDRVQEAIDKCEIETGIRKY
ncbi:zinc finger MYM-type protein 1-like [Cynara cardunculus var. scolymus]|uniref:zinc finger MYM-type protein 1-like n=1 Tax=Cynara cardunculus var. scolymus TaxID=59895 RepID=UPI000D62B588|nr:zinc finger MYM-type protein 1-like [Cynara cardunculus var. scolymus]